MNGYTEVLVTGKLHILDMGAELLRENRIGCFTREIRSSGIQFAMPAAPFEFPRTWWSPYVLPECGEDAEALIETLPIQREPLKPDVWECCIAGKFRKFFQMCIGVYISLSVISLLFGLLGIMITLISG